MSIIPDGYELLVGRNGKNARAAIEKAVERGFPVESVLSQREGYLIPLGDDEILSAEVVEIEAPSESWNKTQIAEFAEKWEMDISGASTKAEQLAAINAEIERRTAAAAESGTLSDGAAGGSTDESTKED